MRWVSCQIICFFRDKNLRHQLIRSILPIRASFSSTIDDRLHPSSSISLYLSHTLIHSSFFQHSCLIFYHCLLRCPYLISFSLLLSIACTDYFLWSSLYKVFYSLSVQESIPFDISFFLRRKYFFFFFCSGNQCYQRCSCATHFCVAPLLSFLPHSLFLSFSLTLNFSCF